MCVFAEYSNGSRAGLPLFRIASGVEDRQNDDFDVLDGVEHAVREAANQSAADVLVDDRECGRGLADRRKRGFGGQKDVIAEARPMPFVLLVRLAPFGLGFGTDDDLADHEPFAMRALITSHGAPAAGSRR